MDTDLITFLTLAAISIASAIGMLVSRNTVYSAMNLVMNFITIALFYLLLGGPFIALAQVTVYAGAIMVIFLFVIMLLGVERRRHEEVFAFQLPMAVILAVALIAEAVYILFFRASEASTPTPAPITEGYGTPRAIADVLFNRYAFPVEIIAIILLVAMVGVIAMTKRRNKSQV